MKVTFVCLANSNKERGRCIAGIEIKDGKPVIVNGKHKWIRPVCRTQFGEVPPHLVWQLRPLDIIEIETKEKVTETFQTENVRFDTSSIHVVGAYSRQDLEQLCSVVPDYIFGTRGKAISEIGTNDIDHSLLLLSVKKFEISSKKYSDKKTQLRLVFSYWDVVYDFPITDPVFLDKYRLDKDLLALRTNIYITVSLSVPFEGWHYKLVAAIL